ncbi:riboflavin aldehyde-forming enzyme [Diplocarpon rosae]|nr:riboflavin aldehyde-forming enzyme [Diplocarpon rosae]
MKSTTTFALGALVASVAIAQPHHRHQHRDQHHKRGVVWVTDVEYVYETVAVVQTIWVEPGFKAPPLTDANPTSTPSSDAAAPTNPLRPYFENVSKASAPSSSVPAAPPIPPVTPAVPAYTYVAPAPSVEPAPEPQVYSAPPVETPIPVYSAPPVETPIPVYSAPAPAPETTTPAAAAAKVPTYATTPSGANGGVCSVDSPCEGDITYYEAGLGACGTTNDGSVEKVVALPHGMMGTQSNGNPYCGMTVTIMLGSKTTHATVVDKCMGCDDNSIDLSTAAFADLAEFAVGRTQAKWYID